MNKERLAKLISREYDKQNEFNAVDDWWLDCSKLATTILSALRKEIEKIKGYIHDMDCRTRTHHERGCTCGLDRANDALDDVLALLGGEGK